MVRLSAFDELLAPAHEAAVTLDATLLGADGESLFERSFAARRPIAADDPKAVADALGEALTDTTGQARRCRGGGTSGAPALSRFGSLRLPIRAPMRRFTPLVLALALYAVPRGASAGEVRTTPGAESGVRVEIETESDATLLQRAAKAGDIGSRAADPVPRRGGRPRGPRRLDAAHARGRQRPARGA